MGTRIFVGNLPIYVNEKQLLKIFERCGRVNDVKVVTDHRTGCSKGFAFITMAGKSDADRAIAALNNVEVDGRSLVVTEARSRIGLEHETRASDRAGSIRIYRREEEILDPFKAVG